MQRGAARNCYRMRTRRHVALGGEVRRSLPPLGQVCGGHGRDVWAGGARRLGHWGLTPNTPAGSLPSLPCPALLHVYMPAANHTPLHPSSPPRGGCCHEASPGGRGEGGECQGLKTHGY